jgi:hypothetical protein
MGDRSVRAGDLRQSVVVTGDGNNVALTFGDTGIRLPLLRKQFPPPERRRRPMAGEPPRALDFLVPEAGRLPLIGRKDLFAELQAWLDDEVDISVCGLIGRAGIGKTRLALDFCRTIDCDRGAKGEWIAGFLSATDLTAVVDTLATHSLNGSAEHFSSSTTPPSATRLWHDGSTDFPTRGSITSSASSCSTVKRRRPTAGGTS